MKLIRPACLLFLVGLAVTGCCKKKDKVTAPVQAAPKATAVVSPAAATNAVAVGPASESNTREERLAMRAQRHRALIDQTVQAQQETVTNLFLLALQMNNVETAARTNNTELQAAYDVMTRAREDYEAKLAALPEMKPLAARRDELQVIYSRMSERKQLLEQEKTKP